MGDMWLKLAEQAPNALAVIIMAYLFLQAEKQREERRVANAKEMEVERRAHDLSINNMWASYIKSLMDKQDETFKYIAGMIHEHEERTQQRYDRLGITKDLIKAAKERKELS